MTQDPQCRAVLTGDLVNSRDAGRDRIDATMALLAETAMAIGSWCRHPAQFTRFRGDGWQMMVGDASLALWAGVHILSTLRADADALATRVGIGIGSIDFHGDPDLRSAAGTAFVHSGEALDLLTRRERMSIMGEEPYVSNADKAVCILLDERLRHWSRPQAEAAALYLRPHAPDGPDIDEPEPETQAAIAARLGISKQAANYRLTGAGAVAIREALLAHQRDARKRCTP